MLVGDPSLVVKGSDCCYWEYLLVSLLFRQAATVETVERTNVCGERVCGTILNSHCQRSMVMKMQSKVCGVYDVFWRDSIRFGIKTGRAGCIQISFDTSTSARMATSIHFIYGHLVVRQNENPHDFFAAINQGRRTIRSDLHVSSFFRSFDTRSRSLRHTQNESYHHQQSDQPQELWSSNQPQHQH